MSTSAKWLRNAAKINAVKVKYVACRNQEVGVIVAKANPADLKRIGVVSSGTDTSGEKRILPTFSSSITALGLFRSLYQRGFKETVVAFAENEDAKWNRPKGCGFTEVEQRTLQECKRLLEERVKPVGAPPKVPSVPLIKSRSGPGGEDAKKPENGGVAKPSPEGANGGLGGGNGKNSGGGNGKNSGGGNGKNSEGGNGKPDGGVAEEGGNGGDGATEGAGEGGIVEKVLEKLHEIIFGS